MISYLCGTVQNISEKYTIIDVGGIGYRVHIAGQRMNSISKIGEQIKLFTHYSMNPRDGAIELYGFVSPEELGFFELLTSISGIGPKSAQAILARSELQPLQLAILEGDAVYLNKVAGLGPKTGQRLIIELKEKIAALPLAAGASANLTSDAEAVEALMALGYNQYQAREAVKNLDSKTSLEEKVTAALKNLGTKK